MENFEIEVRDAYDRDTSEGASVGARIGKVQGVFQERVEGRIKFNTYVVRQ